MKKKKVLSFIDWYAPGYRAGGGQRAFFNMVSYLKDEFDFYIITRNTDFLETKPYDGIESDKWVKRSEGEYVWYCSEETISFFLYKRLTKEVNADFAYINGVYSFKFSILPLILFKNISFKNKIILGTYGMLAPTAINIKSRKKKFFLALSKMIGLYKNVTLHATSENEIQDIKSVFGNKVSVKYAPHLPENELPELKLIEKKLGELKLVSIARISPEKNTLFALECLQDMSEIDGQIIFEIYGPVYDDNYWKECKEIIKILPENISVNYKGIAKGNEVLELLGNYHFLFMPTRGENFGYVILESFMAGRPVIISDQTPWRDLREDGCGYDLSLSTIKTYTDVIETCLKINQEKYNIHVSSARGKAVKFIEDKKMIDENRKLFE